MKKLIVLSCSALLLSACGGGGGTSPTLADRGTAGGDSTQTDTSAGDGSGLGSGGADRDADSRAAAGAIDAADLLCEEPGTTPTDLGPYSVVGVIDTGINVYHEEFYHDTDLPQSFLTEFGVTKICDLTRTGTYEERVAADLDSCWNDIGYNDIVYFTGTRIFGAANDYMQVDIDEGNTGVDGEVITEVTLASDELPILDDANHGTNVTSAVLRANPDAIIYFSEQGGLGFDGNSLSLADDIDKTGLHPLVDIISTSFGQVADLFDIPKATYRAVVENGKLHMGACANDATTCDQDATGGPAWSVGIAGFQTDGSRGKVGVFSGSTPDVVADWTQTLADSKSLDAQRTTSGTSFATPRTAGMYSAVLTAVRTGYGDYGSGADAATRGGDLITTTACGEGINTWGVRRSMQKAAIIPDLDGYDPTAVDGGNLTPAVPVPPEGYYTIIGWGVIEPEKMIQPMVDDLTLQTVLPERALDVETYQSGRFENRKNVWGDAGDTGEVN